ncbi:hypothetical protein DESC_920029 [Desulfosarcina cetonica]|nr:hypothetical protein DESC_920029 [Desulfosarcina cetonica]
MSNPGADKGGVFTVHLTHGQGIGATASEGKMQTDPRDQCPLPFLQIGKCVFLTLDVIEDALDIDVQRRVIGKRYADAGLVVLVQSGRLACLDHWIRRCRGAIHGLPATAENGYEKYDGRRQ